MESFANIDDDAYWAEFDPLIQQIMATQDLPDDTFIVPTPGPLQLEAGATLDDLFNLDFGVYDDLLAEQSSSNSPSTNSAVTSSFESSPQAYTEPLQTLNPTLSIPDDALPLSEDPSVDLIPRGFGLHQHDEEIYTFGARASNDYTSLYNEQDQAFHQQNVTAQASIQQQATQHLPSDTTTGASRKRKAPSTLDGVVKVRKISQPPTIAPKITASITTSSLDAFRKNVPGRNALSTDSSSSNASDITTPTNRKNSTMPQFAPQAPISSRAFAPPPAPDDQHALLHGSFATYAANNPTYGQHTLGRPPPNVCLPLNIELGLVELMTFFPNSVQVPLLAIRLMCNGFDYQTIAKMQLDPVDELTDENAHTVEERIKWQFKDAGGCEWAHKKTKRTMWQQIAKGEGPHQDLTANYFQLRHEYVGKKKGQARPWGHWKLKSIYGAVDPSKWPKDDDRMVLTQCLDFARDNPQLDLDTSHWEWIIQLISPEQPGFPTGYTTRDAEVLFRYSALYPTRRAMRNARAAAKKTATKKTTAKKGKKSAI